MPTTQLFNMPFRRFPVGFVAGRLLLPKSVGNAAALQSPFILIFHRLILVMRPFIFTLVVLLSTAACQQTTPTPSESAAVKPLKDLLEQYYQERLPLFPLEATFQGIEGYNDQLPITISEGHRQKLRDFFSRYQTALTAIDPTKLDDNDRISYDILQWECNIGLGGLTFPDHYLPINQFDCLPLVFGQLGSGSGAQPFKTVSDYDNWLKRVAAFSAWCDTAIVYMCTGLSKGYVLPTSLIVKVIPQVKEQVVKDPTKSLFYGPIQQLPGTFSEADKTRLTGAYTKAIGEQLVPAYQRLGDFFEKEYLPKGRPGSGYADVPGGKERYQFLSKYWTTTDRTPDEIFALGEQEVARIRSEMEKVKSQVGFKGDLKAFFDFVRTDKKFMPFKTPEAVTAWYASLESIMKPQLNKMFDLTPRTKFEVRRTESFREASASAEYIPGTADGSRPGIFYVPVPDATKHNVVGGEALFLHEAIPGHHYQISLQQENTQLPNLRRFLWYGAYGEGWALYTESLGKELGLYADPYQYFGMLSSEMHRAIRLVVDVGLHTKGWTREQAIQYSKDNEAEPEESIVSEIERYMANPGQALSYKIGQLKILELRRKAQDALGDKFELRQFHNQVLDAGCLPLSVLEAKINRWIEKKG